MAESRSAPGQPPRDAADLQIAEMLRKKEPRGYELLLARHGTAVKASIRRRFGRALDSVAADDVMAQAIARVWRTRSPYDPALGSLRGWLLTIAERCALLELARRRRLGDGSADFDQFQDRRDGHQNGEGDALGLWHDVVRIIDRLPPLQREVLLADLDHEGRAPTELLTQKLGSPPESLYVARSKGLAALRTGLEKLGHAAPMQLVRAPHQDGRPPSGTGEVTS